MALIQQEGRNVNPFEQHGIKHLSASSINLFAAEPAMWVMQKLAKKSTGVGPAAHRGTASEAGIVMGLLNPDAPIVECQQHALDEFDRLVIADLDGKAAKERAAIMNIVEHGIKKLRIAGIPDEVQHKIEITLPGVAVPFIGYVDVGWSNHGIRLDIKTKLRSVNSIEEAHNRQVSLYLYGTNKTGRVCYITPRDAEIFTLENTEKHVEQARQIALRIQNFLALTDDTEKLIASVVPNYGSFYWDANARSTGREVFGM
jgi:hypothetical protein